MLYGSSSNTENLLEVLGEHNKMLKYGNSSNIEHVLEVLSEHNKTLK